MQGAEALALDAEPQATEPTAAPEEAADPAPVAEIVAAAEEPAPVTEEVAPEAVEPATELATEPTTEPATEPTSELAAAEAAELYEPEEGTPPAAVAKAQARALRKATEARAAELAQQTRVKPADTTPSVDVEEVGVAPGAAPSPAPEPALQQSGLVRAVSSYLWSSIVPDDNEPGRG